MDNQQLESDQLQQQLPDGQFTHPTKHRP